MATATTDNGTPKQTAVALAEREMEYTPFMASAPIKLSASIVRSMLCVPTRSGKLPSDVQCVKYMMLNRARLLNPFEGDSFLLGYDTADGPMFSMITAHQAFLKRAETHPQYDGLVAGVIVQDVSGEVVDRQGDFTFDDDTLLGAWATVYFKERSHPMHKRLKLSTFNTGQSRWKKDPAGMIVKCAEGDALRSAFPTMLGGMYLEDELDLSDLASAVTPARVAGRATRSPLTDQLALNAPAVPSQLEQDLAHGVQQQERETVSAGREPDQDAEYRHAEASEADAAPTILDSLAERLRVAVQNKSTGMVEDARKWAKGESDDPEVDVMCDEALGRIKPKTKTQKELGG